MLHRGIVFIGQYILREDCEDVEYTEICSKFVDDSVKSVLFRMLVMSLSVVAMNTGPFYAFFI